MWKMLHLLYTLRPGRNGLTAVQLDAAGIDCGPDTIEPLIDAGVVAYDGNLYSLAKPARRILGSCIVGNKRWSSDDLWVDVASAFVIMPFREPWSDDVYRHMIEPAVTGAGLACVRGDAVVRVGDLTQNVWGALLHAGLVIADVSAPNVNVFYELGLSHALGKDTFILKQATATVPADIGGAHYHEYDPSSLPAAQQWLTTEIRNWADRNRVDGVAAARS